MPGVVSSRVPAVSSTIMMVLFFLIVAYAPVLLIRYQAGSDGRGVAGEPGAGLLDPVASVFADVDVPAGQRRREDWAGNRLRA